jgi:hypothetical protein
MEAKLHAFLTSTPDGDERPATRSGHFTIRSRTHRIGGKLDRIDLDMATKR